MAAMRAPTSRSMPRRFAFTSPRPRTPSRKLRWFSDNSKRNASVAVQLQGRVIGNDATRAQPRGCQEAVNGPTAFVRVLGHGREDLAGDAPDVARLEMLGSLAVVLLLGNRPTLARYAPQHELTFTRRIHTAASPCKARARYIPVWSAEPHERESSKAHHGLRCRQNREEDPLVPRVEGR